VENPWTLFLFGFDQIFRKGIFQHALSAQETSRQIESNGRCQTLPPNACAATVNDNAMGCAA
jgi:hypothetical protein